MKKCIEDIIYQCISACEITINILFNKVFVYSMNESLEVVYAGFDIYHYMYDELRWSLIDSSSNRNMLDVFIVKTFINLNIMYKSRFLSHVQNS